MLWDEGAVVFFRGVLALSNVDVKPSVLLDLWVRVSHELPPSPNGGIHFYFIFYTSRIIFHFAFILIEVWSWQATQNTICLKILQNGHNKISEWSHN